MIFIDCGNGNPQEYDSEFARRLQNELDGHGKIETVLNWTIPLIIDIILVGVGVLLGMNLSIQ